MKKYFYFISYVKTDPFGFGNIEIIRDSPITEYKHTQSIREVTEEVLKNKHNERNASVIILNYQLLRVE